MHLMVINRRQFLAMGAAAVWAPTVLGSHSKHFPAPVMSDGVISEALYVAARQANGRYEAVVLDAQGSLHLVVPMPARGHSFALNPQNGRAVVFGRQPGFFAVAFSIDGTRAPVTLEAAQGRHFFGHGVYSSDGSVLFATENDFDAGKGVVGLYDASETGAYRRVGEFDSGGIGPHELVLLNDGKTLCVANGGILTHPDYGKLELNLDSMQPSLAYIDVASGRLIERVSLPQALHRLSIRHLALSADGSVWFGCQYMGSASDQPPLVGRHRRGFDAELFVGSDDVLRGCRNYIGSVAADPTGTLIATSSPVGNQVLYWDTTNGNLLGVTPLQDGCGVAPYSSSQFLVNSGTGALIQVGPHTPAQTILSASSDVAWDNHFRRI